MCPRRLLATRIHLCHRLHSAHLCAHAHYRRDAQSPRKTSPKSSDRGQDCCRTNRGPAATLLPSGGDSLHRDPGPEPCPLPQGLAPSPSPPAPPPNRWHPAPSRGPTSLTLQPLYSHSAESTRPRPCTRQGLSLGSLRRQACALACCGHSSRNPGMPPHSQNGQEAANHRAPARPHCPRQRLSPECLSASAYIHLRLGWGILEREKSAPAGTRPADPTLDPSCATQLSSHPDTQEGWYHSQGRLGRKTNPIARPNSEPVLTNHREEHHRKGGCRHRPPSRQAPGRGWGDPPRQAGTGQGAPPGPTSTAPASTDLGARGPDAPPPPRGSPAGGWACSRAVTGGHGPTAAARGGQQSPTAGRPRPQARGAARARSAPAPHARPRARRDGVRRTRPQPSGRSGGHGPGPVIPPAAPRQTFPQRGRGAPGAQSPGRPSPRGLGAASAAALPAGPPPAGPLSRDRRARTGRQGPRLGRGSAPRSSGPRTLCHLRGRAGGRGGGARPHSRTAARARRPPRP